MYKSVLSADQSAQGRKIEAVRLRRVVAAAMAGTVVEWYEFFLYATAATLVFNKIFFPPTDDPLNNILAAFLTYAVGFAARPLGGIVFGHFGDKYGRKRLLQIAILLVGIATFLMGCLPTFGQVGYLAPMALVFLRFVQGIAVGGEYGGAVLLVAEHSPDRERGFWTSWPQAAAPIGSLISTAVLLILSSTLPEEAFLSWGWRVAFWLSVVVVALGYYLRTKVTDAPIFIETREALASRGDGEEAPVRSGVAEVLRMYPGKVLVAMGLRVGENILYYLVITFSITYLVTQVNKDVSQILLVLVGAHVAHAVLIPLIGRVSDVVGRKPLFVVGVVLAAGWGFVAFPLFDTGNDGAIFAGIMFGLVAHALMYATEPSLMAEMFPTRVRYSGVSLGSQVSSIFAGSLAPIIATMLLRSYGSWVPIALYVLVGVAISALAVSFIREAKGVSLYAIDAQDRERAMRGER